MNILILNYEFPPLGGGAGNATHYLLREFAKYPDLEIDLVTSSVDGFKVEKFSENITIHFLDINKAKKGLHYQTNRNILTYSFKSYLYCKKLKKQKQFDLIHAFFGIPCGYIAMKLGLPYIVSLRGSDVPFYNKRFYYLDKLVFKRLSKKIWQKAQTVVANSEGLRSLALQAAPNQKISVIYNGVDTEEFKPLENKVVNNPIKIISTGRLIQRKGYRFLIEAVAGNKNMEVELIGEGNLESELKELAKEKKANVKFLSKKPHDQIVGFLQKADIFVLPSLNEGMSNSILEAMACGLPIIATDTGGSRELIQGNGFVVPKANPSALRDVITRYLKNQELLKQHGQKSRILAEKMSWAKVAERYIKICKNIL